MMAKDPAFLFYSSDFLAGIQDLTMEERGQYITLLCLQHQKGRLSDKIIKLTVQQVSKDVLDKFKKDDDGLWYNSRLETEIGKRKDHSEKQRQRALDGWERRKSEAHVYAVANAVALPLENENVNEDINKKRDKGVQGKKGFIPPTLQDVEQYFKEKGYTKDYAFKVFDYYNTGNWKDSAGKPVLNWKQKMSVNWLKGVEGVMQNKPTEKFEKNYGNGFNP